MFSWIGRRTNRLWNIVGRANSTLQQVSSKRLRGMKFFRAAYYKEMKQDYLLIKEQAEEYERDNKTLRQLIEENERFQDILNALQAKNKGKENEP